MPDGVFAGVGGETPDGDPVAYAAAFKILHRLTK